MDQQAMIEDLRWWSQLYFWLSIVVTLLGAIAGVILNVKRQHVEAQLRELREHLTQAELDALRTQSQDLQQHVAEARQQQAAAEQELREVQAQQRPRTLTEAHVNILMTRLRNGPTGKIEVQNQKGDADAEQFADQLYIVLADMGWTMQGRGSISEVGEVLVGLTIVRSPVDLPGELLLHTLREIGLEVSEKINPSINEGVVRLIVGRRPWPRH